MGPIAAVVASGKLTVDLTDLGGFSCIVRVNCWAWQNPLIAAFLSWAVVQCEQHAPVGG